MHEDELTQAKTFEILYSDDVGRDSGRQTLEISTGIQTHVLIANGAEYFDGNYSALTVFYGLSAAAARKIGNRWVSVPTSNRDYGAVASQVTLASALRHVMPDGQLTETAPRKLDGTPVIGIRGRSGTDVVTLEVTRSKTPLPLAAIINAPGSTSPIGSTTVKFTDWGERLGIKPPASSLPVADFTKY